MKTLYPLFLENIKKNRLIEDHDTVFLGFSGGKDSVTLFYLLEELKKDIPFGLIIAYFNHRIRSNAMQEEEWVKDFCQTRGIELVIGSKNVIKFKTDAKLNLEHAASLSRYRFFQEVSSRYKNAKVATAHTQSDLTETFFIKLFRGSGLQGLSTIYSKKENTIIRPLLLYTQEEIFSFLQRNKIEFFTDYTNQQETFLRNKIRLHLIPEILKIEPDINKHVYQTVSIIQEEYDYFNEFARTILDRYLILGKILPVHVLNLHHLAIQRHIIREYIRVLKGNLLNISFDHIEVIRTQSREVMGLAIPGLQLKFNKGFIFPIDLSIPEYNYQITTPGIVETREIQKKIIIKKTKTYRKPKNNYSIIVPANVIKFPLTVRNPKKRDKYVKINTTINQKVFEMIRASGIPSLLRNLCPVVVNGDNQIIWTVDSPVAEHFKVKDKKGKEYLMMEIRDKNIYQSIL